MSFSDANSVTSLTINGLPASTANSYAGWNRQFNLSPGINVFNVLASDSAIPANTSNTTFVVNYTSPPAPDGDSYGLPDAWETGHGLDPTSDVGINGDAGDFDFDGLSNFLEFATGLPPDEPSIPPASVATAINPATGATHLTFSYRRLRIPSNISYTVLASSDLVAWNIADTEPISVSPNPDSLTETITVRILPALDRSSGKGSWVRLKSRCRTMSSQPGTPAIPR